MAYLQKTITTQFGVDADCLVVQSANIIAQADGTHNANGNLALYLNDTARLNGKERLDNFKFSYNLTDEEVDGNTRLVLLQKIMESNMVQHRKTNEDVERNTLSGNVGQIGFQDAVLVV